MRIVVIANWWYERGGLGKVMLDEATALQARGHEVIPFASAHPSNAPSPYSGYFPAFVETADLGRGTPFMTRARTAARLVRNPEAMGRFQALLDEQKPDLIHLHNTVRQLSPGILSKATRQGIPIVMTLHDYGVICPQGQLYRHDRIPCLPPNCSRGNPVHVVTGSCVKQSMLASTIAAVEYGVHRMLGSYTRSVTRFLAPSEFLADVVTDAGIPKSKVQVLVNGVHPGPEPSALPRTGGHVLFMGRIAREKGVGVLLEAARLLPDIPIRIAGDGPLRAVLEQRAPANTRFVGHQLEEGLAALLSDAVAVVSPSTWFENAPLSVLEAMRAGRPVIATDLGGHRELLRGPAGTLIPPGDPGRLAAAISELWNDRSLARQLGETARARMVAEYSLEKHVTHLVAIYEAILAGSARETGELSGTR